MSKKLTALAFLIGVMASWLRYVPVIDDPWDDSLASINGAVFMGRIVQCWQRVGFEELRGMPALSAAPMAQGKPQVLPYLNHPPFYPWLIRAVVRATEFSERGFRLVPIAFSSLTGGLIAALLARSFGLWPALFALLLWLCTPMSYLFGYMPNPESAVLFFIVATFALHLSVRRSDSAFLWGLFCVTFLLGTFMDWQAFFVAPAIWLFELTARRGEGRRRRSLWLLPLGTLSVLITLSLFGWWQGGLSEAISGMSSAATKSAAQPVSFSASAWWLSQAALWERFFGLPLMVVTLVVTPWAMFQALVRRDPVARLLLALAVPAVLNVAAFRRHAFDHHFWWYYALPYALLAAVLVFRALLRWRLLALAFALTLLSVSSLGTYRELRGFKNPLWKDAAVLVNRLAGEEDLLVTVDEPGRETFYIDAWVWHATGGPAEIEAILTLWRGDQLKGRSLYFLVRADSSEALLLAKSRPKDSSDLGGHRMFAF